MKPYKKLPNTVELPKLEEEVLELWNANNTFQKSLDQRRQNKTFVFYDGPPFATGTPHYGHLLAGTLKDIVPRYKTMKGFLVHRKFGWDCHGLPIEMEMQQALGLASSADIERFGVQKFNDACRENVLRYASEWQQTTLRSGRWVDFANAYKTMDRGFIESVWWAFAELYKKNLIYEGFKVLPYSWKASTILSNFEANLNYKTVQDPAITVKFKRKNSKPNKFFLAWTTTPWTLLSNLALCVRADLKYCEVLYRPNNETFILSEKATQKLFKKGEVEIQKTFPGEALVDDEYEPLFPYAERLVQGAFRVVADDFVDDSEGVGVVHLAPAYGEDDKRIADKNGIGSYDPIDDDGNFNDDADLVKGMNFLDANKTIIRSLKAKNAVVRHGVVEHSYPYCWRTDTPLMYKAISTTFVRVSALQEQLKTSNRDVGWLPKHLKAGRFGNWLENATDWAISRNRYWGAPIPLWKNRHGHVICCGASEASETALSEVLPDDDSPFFLSLKTLEKLAGKKIPDLHKPGLDAVRLDLKPHQKGSKWGGSYTRVNEVLDCWFESGAMPFGQRHFPFQEGDNEQKPPKTFPADFIAEGLDQTRGWFYTMMVLGTAIYGRSPYKNVVVNGLVLAEDGKKMSKRLKNYPSPEVVMERYGADALRLYLVHSGAAKGDSLRFSEAGVLDLVKSLLLPTWHATSFFTSYARIDGWHHSKAPQKAESPPQHSMDRWLRSLAQNLITDVQDHMDSYALHKVPSLLVRFADRLTNTYIRRNRRRFWKAEQDDSKDDAYQTLHQTLLVFVKVMAPFAPFITETLYSALGGDMESVHLESFPEPRRDWVDQKLEDEMGQLEAILGLGRSLRKSQNIKIRQPLKSITIMSHDETALSVAEQHKNTIKDELNVKEVFVAGDLGKHLHYEVKCNFKTLGKRYGKRVQAINDKVMGLAQEDIEELLSANQFVLRVDGKSITLLEEDLVVRHKAKDQQALATEGLFTCTLDTALTDDLKSEGLARELVHALQKSRQQLNLNYTDRIFVCLHSNELNSPWLKKHKPYISKETLATKVAFVERDFFEKEPTTKVALQQQTLLNGKEVLYSIQKSED